MDNRNYNHNHRPPPPMHNRNRNHNYNLNHHPPPPPPHYNHQNNNEFHFNPNKRRRQQEYIEPNFHYHPYPLIDIEAAVATALSQTIQSGNNVSISTLSDSVLSILHAPSFDSLGFQLHQIPSLHQLILIESKINAFILSYVAVHRITTLFDLHEALCRNEGVESFQLLQLGPFLQHPLVRHLFCLSDVVVQVYRITSYDVLVQLSCFLKDNRTVLVHEFLEFLAHKHEVTNPALLGLRIQSLGMHIGFLLKARNAQDFVLKKRNWLAKEKLGKRSKKRRLFSLKKQELDDRFGAISEQDTSIASVQVDEVEGLSNSFDAEEIENDSLVSNEGQPSSVKRKSGKMINQCNQSIKKKNKIELRQRKRELRLINTLDNNSIRIFMTNWKEACREHTTIKVLDKMLRSYNKNSTGVKKNHIRSALCVFPFDGLLNVAVTSIKRGMWDSMYYTFQLMGELGQEDTQVNKLELYENIAVRTIEIPPKCTSKPAPCVKLEDIAGQASDYLAQHSVLSGGSQLVDRVLMFAKRLSLCEVWLANKFSVNDFKLLGHGDFYSFLERNTSLLPKELVNFVTSEVQEHRSLEISMVERQLVMLLSQASSSLWEEGVVSKDKITELLARQFPFLSFKIIENGSTQEVLDFVKKQESGIASNCVIFSATLLGTSKYIGSGGSSFSDMLDDSRLIADIEQIGGNLGSITSRDAINNILKAPFLSDLNSWSHWDLLYGPSLGPLLEWLLTEVNVEGLLCLLTRDGKIIRVDHSASVNLFFQALLEGSPFQMAVQLLSLFVVSGGKRHVPLSLLKCQARQGFEVIMGKFVQNMDFNEGQKSGKRLMGNSSGENNAIALISRIVIDCLILLPSEFHCFVADVLLAGLQSLVKDIASAFLGQCKGNEERLMLHEIGFSLGIVKWVYDHNSVCPITDRNSLMSINGAQSPTCMGSKMKGFEASSDIPSGNKDDLYRNDTDTSISMGVSKAEHSTFVSDHLVEEDIKEAAHVVESIRRDEFGLDLNISDMESSLLKKQHARLGRALHCLSEELYSQDSHFLLELVCLL